MELTKGQDPAPWVLLGHQMKATEACRGGFPVPRAKAPRVQVCVSWVSVNYNCTRTN